VFDQKSLTFVLDSPQSTGQRFGNWHTDLKLG